MYYFCQTIKWSTSIILSTIPTILSVFLSKDFKLQNSLSESLSLAQTSTAHFHCVVCTKPLDIFHCGSLLSAGNEIWKFCFFVGFTSFCFCLLVTMAKWVLFGLVLWVWLDWVLVLVFSLMLKFSLKIEPSRK